MFQIRINKKKGDSDDRVQSTTKDSSTTFYNPQMAAANTEGGGILAAISDVPSPKKSSFVIFKKSAVCRPAAQSFIIPTKKQTGTNPQGSNQTPFVASVSGEKAVMGEATTPVNVMPPSSLQRSATTGTNVPPKTSSTAEGPDTESQLIHFSGTGVAMFTYPDGAVYDGHWKNWERHGMGYFEWPEGNGSKLKSYEGVHLVHKNSIYTFT